MKTKMSFLFFFLSVSFLCLKGQTLTNASSTLTNGGLDWTLQSAYLYSTGSKVVVQGSGGTGGSVLIQSDNGQSGAGKITLNANQGTILFNTNGLNKMILLNNGNFGIGTATPAAKLDVNGEIYSTGISNSLGDFLIKASSPGSSSGSITIGAGQNNPSPAGGSVTIASGNGYASGSINLNIASNTYSGSINLNGKTAINSTLNVSGVTSFSGNVGIGTTTPAAKLDVNGEIYSTGSTNATGDYFIKGKTYSTGTPGVVTAYGASGTNASYPTGGNVSVIAGSGYTPGNVTITAGTGYANGSIYLNAPYNVGGGIFINGKTSISGNVGIGVAPSTTSKLAVDGKIECEEIEVKNIGADYVFDSNYKLRSLGEIENFIKQNGHLPGVNPASETQKGVNLGEFNQKLLEKVEELTLYMIDLKKENEAMKAEIKSLNNKN